MPFEIIRRNVFDQALKITKLKPTNPVIVKDRYKSFEFVIADDNHIQYVHFNEEGKMDGHIWEGKLANELPHFFGPVAQTRIQTFLGDRSFLVYTPSVMEV
ncbi:MAG: hypothetical protein HW400_435 [Candidatus Levybacteria bacterium]|nr:hypothetical protein [Candidatus Levybacteria bacterium]